jgi:hypothetical protein
VGQLRQRYNDDRTLRPIADLGQTFSSTKQAADQYAGESPKGVEPLTGVKGAYMVFDPKTPNRRVFVEYKGKVYMIVSQDRVPLPVLAKAVIQRRPSPPAPPAPAPSAPCRRSRATW